MCPQPIDTGGRPLSHSTRYSSEALVSSQQAPSRTIRPIPGLRLLTLSVPTFLYITIQVLYEDLLLQHSLFRWLAGESPLLLTTLTTVLHCARCHRTVLYWYGIDTHRLLQWPTWCKTNEAIRRRTRLIHNHNLIRYSSRILSTLQPMLFAHSPRRRFYMYQHQVRLKNRIL